MATNRDRIARLFGVIPTRLPTHLRGTHGRVHYCGGVSIEAELRAPLVTTTDIKRQAYLDWHARNRERRKAYFAARYEQKRKDPDFVALNRKRANDWHKKQRSN